VPAAGVRNFWQLTGFYSAIDGSRAGVCEAMNAVLTRPEPETPNAQRSASQTKVIGDAVARRLPGAPSRGGVVQQSCPACNEIAPHRPLYTKNECRILRCEACGLGRAETTGFEPSQYYTADYFSGERPDGYADYLGAEDVLRREFAQTLNFIRKFHPSGRLLEIGCAYGFLLDEAKRNFDVTGIELADDAARHCRDRGLHVVTGTTESLTSDFGSFDVIAMLDVIEHLSAPRETMIRLAEHLKPGGVIVITTGDFGSLAAKLAGSRWRLMTPPQHLWFFTQKSMRGLANAVGLDVEHVDHPSKIVPLSLIGFQLARMMGMTPHRLSMASRLGVPVNLFDAMRVVMRKPNP
jgi:2-polyprenyl-3-methyl-5-hydroxy-6-metoxy-1,4-benzoquinol methylase